eukprot:4452296-Ditylum_brightwellii.AAC.1
MPETHPTTEPTNARQNAINAAFKMLKKPRCWHQVAKNQWVMEIAGAVMDYKNNPAGSWKA